ncbi:MAG: hypothetical protein Q8S11_10050 [Daejeonella sp.]|uniref:hypothetical protein n=1 Tax=Daejeonella sp. TaxID=2805397 RepID=UPI002732A4E4|nr:hypothetical protein [Daejeonella sp.]MDP3468665.1 hypothetical protein [Daejeonella sp.]
MIVIDKKLLLVLLTCFVIFSGSCKKSKNRVPEPIAESNVLFNEFTDPLVLSQAGTKLFVDMDKDGTNDLAFRLSVLPENLMTTFFYIAEPLNENVQLVACGLLDAYAFPTNDVIFDIIPSTDSKRWSGSNGILLEKYVYQSDIERIGMFNGSRKLYLGVRIKKERVFHYGWVEIRHEASLDIDRIVIAGTGLFKLSERAIKAGIH